MKKVYSFFCLVLFSFMAGYAQDVTTQFNGNLEIIGNPVSQNDQSSTYYSLSNKGIGGSPHIWKMVTASYAGGWGVASNGYEIWEYPDQSYESGNLEDHCCRQRFVIQTSREHANDYSAMIVGPRGGLNIGYVPNTIATDINDLSVNGNVGIGTLDTQGYKLAVNGTIRAKEIKVDSDWADFVFKKDYKLPTLGEVKKHIEEKGTLPGIPSESDVKANGVSLGEVNALLLQKIEELTLYVIKQQEEIERLKALNNK